jgi:hypothetical protein
MKIAVIAQDDIINDTFRRAGEVCPVPDDYPNIRRVIRRLSDVQNRNKEQWFKVALRKFSELLQEHYPAVYNQLEKNDNLRQKAINWLRNHPDELGQMIKNPVRIGEKLEDMQRD